MTSPAKNPLIFQRIAFLTVLLTVCLSGLLQAQQSARPSAPKIKSASNEAEQAIQQFAVPAGMRVRLAAAEPLLANPVAFCIGPRGRLYICETFRQQKGVEDNRSHMNWLMDDLGLQSVEERLEMYRRFLGDGISAYSKEDDRIRRLEDSDRDGVFDKSTVFADGFNGILEGTGAGVLVHQGHVYYTNIPRLWRLRDSDHDGIAEDRIPLHHGYGVRVAFRGHDLHGLVTGPDGRIYFSIGDRGYNIVTPEGIRLKRPDTGAVFRCLPDGTQLEVFAYGLRNPQELAFDDSGNLFTADNNSDSGDQARWVYIVEGGDTGWRMHYQYLNDRGPWNREKIWHPFNPDQPAAIIPPVANLADGPSGLVAYPGVGLSKRYDGHFFLADFRGNSARSGIRSFAVERRGAGFELVDEHQFVWSILATDIDFGYDGSIYVSDWVDGWDGPGKGRIYRFDDPGQSKAVAKAGSADLMSNGFDQTSAEELVELLSHRDRRVRQQAQFTLVDRQLTESLIQASRSSRGVIPRLHGLRGLGQLGRQGLTDASMAVLPLLDDQQREIRAEAFRTLTDIIATVRKYDVEDPGIDRELLRHGLQRLGDADERVRYFAAMSLAQTGSRQSIPSLLRFLDANQDSDPYLRHAGAMALTGIAKRHPNALELAAVRAGPSGRMGIVLALRRLRSTRLETFLLDSDPGIVLEAARAIHDEDISRCLPALAALAEQPDLPNPLLRRVLNANYRLGGTEHARRVARLAASGTVDGPLRLEAIEELATWNEPEPLDRVLGMLRPLERKRSIDLKPVLEPALGGILAGPTAVRTAGIKLAAQLGIQNVEPVLISMFRKTDSPSKTRIAALNGLEALQSESFAELIQLAISDEDAALRARGRSMLAKHDPERAVPALIATLTDGQLVEQQAAFHDLATMEDGESERTLVQWMQRLIEEQVPLPLQLDLLDAAATRDSEVLRRMVAKYEGLRPAGDPLAAYRETLEGGSAERGRKIFIARASVSCRRCHIIDGQGGQVGPNLSGIGREKDRTYLLESLVTPSKQIARGFESVIVATEEGKVHAGVIKRETASELQLMTNNGTLITIDPAKIEERTPGRSGMPDDLIKQLSRNDIRDLIEFLATCRTVAEKPSSDP